MLCVSISIAGYYTHEFSQWIMQTQTHYNRNQHFCSIWFISGFKARCILLCLNWISWFSPIEFSHFWRNNRLHLKKLPLEPIMRVNIKFRRMWIITGVFSFTTIKNLHVLSPLPKYLPISRYVIRYIFFFKISKKYLLRRE